ncbi:NADH-quinone oxidoreductase [Crassisporium funariophilum]|nr:NADH-quinone oxidoreductase [Crassisporium funariophilum]
MSDPRPRPRIAIVIYTMYGHIGRMAEGIKAGIQKAGGDADIYQVPETLSDAVLDKMHALGAKPNYPVMTEVESLKEYNGFMFGIPTRYGNLPAQLKAFWDRTGQLWGTGGLAGKYAGVFVSTSGPGGGQETTVITFLSTLTHHGIIYVPFGYSHPGTVEPQKAFKLITSMEEVHGGSPWGAGTFAGGDGQRQPSKLELELAELQGTAFYGIVSKVSFQ